jgi:hypothetical protein
MKSWPATGIGPAFETYTGTLIGLLMECIGPPLSADDASSLKSSLDLILFLWGLEIGSVSLNDSRLLLFHGGDTGSTPVRDASRIHFPGDLTAADRLTILGLPGPYRVHSAFGFARCCRFSKVANPLSSLDEDLFITRLS